MKSGKLSLKYDEKPYHEPFEYINKDLDLLYIHIFLEAFHENRTRINFGDLFKGNYGNIDSIQSEVSDTNDHYSIPDMVYSQAIFLFHDLRMGNITHVGVDDTQEALGDVLITVANIGAKDAVEQARNFIETVRELCELEQKERAWRTKEFAKNSGKVLERMQSNDKSVLFPYDAEQPLQSIQSVLVAVPEHIVIDVLYDAKGIENVEKEISAYMKSFVSDGFLEQAPMYHPKRYHFAKQIENFCVYINSLTAIGNVVNIPFSILGREDFEAVKLLTYLQSRKAIKMRWSDDISWKVDFAVVPITPNSLLGITSTASTTIISDGSKTVLDFDEARSLLTICDIPVKIRKNSDQFHLLRIMFEDRNELGKEWFFSEIAERYDPAARLDNKKFYNAAYQIRRHIARIARLEDVVTTTRQSIHIDPKYIRRS